MYKRVALLSKSGEGAGVGLQCVDSYGFKSEASSRAEEGGRVESRSVAGRTVGRSSVRVVRG